MTDWGDGRPPVRLRLVHQPEAATPPPVGLAVWVSPEARAELVAAVEARLAEEPGSTALSDVRLELDAAAVRARWFDPPSAVRLRRAVGMSPDAVALRVAAAERQALLDCDLSLAVRRAVMGPADPLPPRAALREPAPVPPEGRPSREPVPLLVEHNGELAWTVGVADDAGRVLARQARPDEPIWAAAWQAAQALAVTVDTVGEARRLVTQGHPALSSAALTRDALVNVAPATAVLLSLPRVVVLAPAPLAARVALHAYPAPIRLLPISELPPFPRP